MMEKPELVPDRYCDDCSLCCTVLGVAELDKQPMSRCTNCLAAGGCGIYQNRPYECREFYCSYRSDPALGVGWKPSVAGFVVAPDEHTAEIVIHVDPARPDSWRLEPFYSQIRIWALAAQAQHHHVIVWQGDTRIVVAPADRHDPAAA